MLNFNSEQPEYVRILLNWYSEHKRDLPWRKVKDPYAIWLSEIILQQTRVNQGLPYYHKFIQEFPDITSFAQSPQQEVLRHWQGLGYYSRARNMHATAQNIVQNHNAEFPNTHKTLLTLKGIGPYTAAAIASFSFNEKVAVVDGNVYRVLARVFGIDLDITSTAGKKYFQQLANDLLPDQHHSDYNQGIMEFGALQCLPAVPQCQICPLSHICHAFEHKTQTSLPVKSKKLKKKTRHFNFLVYRHKDHYLMQERTSKDIWKGLYQFPLLEAENFQVEESAMEYSPSKTYKHVLSHQVIEAVFWTQDIHSEKDFKQLSASTSSGIYSIEEIDRLPKSVLIDNYLKEILFL